MPGRPAGAHIARTRHHFCVAQQHASGAPAPDYRFAWSDVSELTSALATLRSFLILAVGTRCLAMEFAQRTRPGLARDCRAARLAPKPSLYMSRHDPPANQPVEPILLAAIAVALVIGCGA